MKTGIPTAKAVVSRVLVRPMIVVMEGKTGIVVFAALMVFIGSTRATARQLHRERCAPRPPARQVVRTPQVVVNSVPQTEVIGAVRMTNLQYFTCLRATGERRRLFFARSGPSSHGEYRAYLAAIRAAGRFVLYVSAFVQHHPDGRTTESAYLNEVDVQHLNRVTFSFPDPDIGLIGLGDIALSVDGYIAWAQVNRQQTATTETIEASTGGPPTIVATAPIPNTLTRLAFHKLAFDGETLTWLYDGRRQSAQLTPSAFPPADRARST
jgi:hypothetical protein